MQHPKRSNGSAGPNLARTWPDSGAIAALEFLERSREVASERVVDDSRRETSPSQREEIAAPGAGSTV